MNSEEDLIDFYKRIFLKTQIKFACKKKSCTDNFCENKDHSLNYLKDPIGMHLICLSCYERNLDELFEKLRHISKKINHLPSDQRSSTCDQQFSTSDQQLSVSDQHSGNSNDQQSSSSEDKNKLHSENISQESYLCSINTSQGFSPNAFSKSMSSNGSPQEHGLSYVLQFADLSDISKDSSSLNETDEEVEPPCSLQSSFQKYGSPCSEQSFNEISNSVQSELLQKFRLSDEEIKLLYDPASKIPGFPHKYPFLDSYKTFKRQKIIIKSKTISLQPDIMNQLENFVQIVLGQTGYSSYESVAIFFMIKSAHKFLKQFVTLMKQHRDNGDLISLVHLILLKIGYGGIHGVHNFFYSTIVKPHDELYEDCVKKQNEYEKLRQEIVDKYEKCSN